TISGGGSLIAHDFEMQLPDAGVTATVVIGSGGTLRMASGGNYFMSAGTLELDAGGTLNIDSGVTLEVQNSAATLQLKTNWAVPAGATVLAKLGGHVASSSYLDVGSGNAGTLLVDGSRSSATIGTSANPFSDWGTTGGSATVTFSTSGTGSYGDGVHVAAAGGTANVNINTGATLSVTNGL